MKRILIPTDFSENAMNAFTYALHLFGHEDVEYTLLNAYVYPAMNMDLIPTISVTIEKESTDGLDELESLIVDKYKNRYALRTLSEYGGVPIVIDRLSRLESFDFIVMGTKGRSADRELFMGSVSRSVVQNSPVPVFLIPTNATFNGISKIVYTTDLQHNESHILKKTIDFAKVMDAHVTVLHIDPDVSSKNWSIEELKEMAEETGYEKINSQEYVNTNEENAILTFAQANDSDLIVLTTYATSILHKILHRSLTKQMLKDTDIPLLIFNRKEYTNIFLG
jgi:nucleotide-binding universal stress UspA family protein